MDRFIEIVCPGGRVFGFRRLRGGISSGMHAVRVQDGAGCVHRFVIRRYSGNWWADTPDIANKEFRTLSLLDQLDIPAPKPLWIDSMEEIFGAPTLVISQLKGTADLAPKDIGSYVRQLAEALAHLHRADLTGVDTGFLDDLPADVHQYLDPGRTGQEREAIERITSHPRGGDVLQAIRANWPEMTARALVHTDYWPGNTVWWRGRLQGIVDWAAPQIGEPALDVAYCRQDLTMLFDAGAADLFLGEYERASDTAVGNLPFWDLIASTRAMPDPALWLPGHEDLGRRDIIAEDMRLRHNAFLENALNKFG